MREKQASASKHSESSEGSGKTDQVKLKPLMGIRPGVYLTALYSLIILIALFFLLVFPGLKNPGAVLALKTEPDGAAIRIDGVYMGTASLSGEIFVPKGEHTLQAVLPGFKGESAVHQIPGRVFGSLFFPLRYPVEFTLKTDDPSSAFALYADDFAQWSFMGEPTPAWQIPLSLSEGAYRAGPGLGIEGADILKAAARFTVTRAALRDLLRAKTLLDSGGLSPSPAALFASTSDILAFLSENPGSVGWLSGLLPSESSAVIRASAWYKNAVAYPTNLRADRLEGARRLEIAGLSFNGVPSAIIFKDGMEKLGSIEKPGPYKRALAVKSFWISENPVPRRLYENFLSENPSWKNEENNLVLQESGGGEVTSVSWYAAQAFCEWLSKRLPSSMSAMEARLPTETELEYVKLSDISLKSTDGGWEWCADPFAPLNFFDAKREAVIAVGSPERSLRNMQPSAGPENRASLPPDLPSPFVSFRVVIAEKDSGF